MFGIYIHIPFCRTACHYCDFHFSTNTQTMGEMEAALVKELELRIQADQPDFNALQSIYFGGGTPSLFELSGLRGLLTRLLPHAPNCREVTLEANPEDVTEERLHAWLEMGINRLSIGLQSFDQKQLDWMNRQHSAEDATQAVQLAADAGFQHISADLIYGLPSRTVPFREEINRFVALPVDHLSAYILTVEDRTVLGNRVERGIQPIPEDGDVSSEYQILCQAMSAEGFEHYEVSNWAKPGGRAVHNQHYWSGLPYWGIGPGAHGFDGASRYANVANNPKYIKALTAATSALGLPREIETLSPTDRYNESLMTGLRTAKGIELIDFAKQFGLRPDVAEPEVWGRFLNQGLIAEIGAGRYRIPESRWVMADAIAAELFVA
ncbi:MAG: coproporphyrinogen III oxidase [Flavobacteriales bacterium]|nr:coproporphyrinogen III oxidase [Flavobacteriales bacterium]